MKNFFQGLRMQVFWRSLKEKIKNRTLRYSHSRVDIKKAKSIGILFDATDLDNRKTVLNYADQLRKQSKQVRLLGFFDNKLKDNNFTFKHFNRRDIDWAYRPKGHNIDDFLAQEFDILINLNPLSATYSEYISALSKASFKIGPVTEHMVCYDMMIDTDTRTSLDQFIHQMEGLLEKTKV